MTARTEHLWAGLKTAGLVTLVAVLIWIWAEAESLENSVTTAHVSFVKDPDQTVRIAGQPGTDGLSVQVRLEGSTSAIDEAQAALREDVKLTPGVGVVPGPPGGPVNLLEAVRESRGIRRAGATVVSVEPAAVQIDVVKLAMREVPIQAELNGIEAEGDIVVSPSSVRITMPEAAAAKLPAGTVVTAVVGPEDLASREEGLQTVQARLRLPPALAQGAQSEFVSLSRETARVMLRVKRRVETLELPPVPVWITLPPTEGSAWDIEVMEPFLRGVTVTGPADLVGRIRTRDLVPIAFVVLSSDDLQATVSAKNAVFAPVPAALIGAAPGNGTTGGGTATGFGDAALMEQVAPLKFSTENRRVELRIRPRADADGDRGAGPDGQPAASPHPGG